MSDKMAGSQHHSSSCKFTWDGGGREVFLSGSFNNWERIPMAKSRSQSGVFTTTVTLPQGRHEYKFLVDGEWMLDMKEERSTNELGIMNNVCWVPSTASDMSAAGLPQGSSYGGGIPEYTPPSPYARGTHPTPLMEATPRSPLLGVAPGAPQIEATPRPPLLGVAPGVPPMEDSDSDSTDSSDTESVSSTTSGGPDLARQPSVSLAVRCYQAPQVLDKDKLSQHIGLLGLSGSVTGIQWKTSRKKKVGHALVRVSPPHMVDEVVMKLNGSMLLGKFKLSVKQHSRKRRGERGRGNKKDKQIKVFVGPLPQFITETHLQEHFSSFKEKIVKIEIARDKGKSKGFGFIFFSNRSSAEAAVRNMNQTLLQGKYRIKVEMSKDKPPQPSSSQAPPTSPSPLLAEDNDSDTESVSSIATSSLEMCQVFINSHPPLPDKMSKKQIADHFSTYKNHFTNAKVIRDKQRKSKAYAILTFADQTLAEEAVLVYNNSMLQGQYKLSLHCKPAGSKETSPKKVPKKRHASSSEGQTTGTSPLESEMPGTSSVSKSKKQQFTVKLACLPPSLTRERLADLLRLYGQIHQLPKIFESKNRYALANFKTLEGAQKAVTGLNQTVHDEYTIKVSLKESQTGPSASPTPLQEVDFPVSPSDISMGPIPVPIQPQPTTPINTNAVPNSAQPPHMAPINVGPIPVPPQPTHRPPFNTNPVPPPPQLTVTLDNVDPLVSVDELKVMVGVGVEWAERTPSLSTQVVLRLSSHEHAQRVVQMMNGMNLLGKAIQATLVTTPTTPPMNSPFQRSASYPATPPYYQSHDPRPTPQSFPPPPHPHPVPLSATPHPPTSGPMPHPPGVQQTLKLSPPDWNRLMSVGSTGRVLFQDIVEPYQSNPSIQIIPKMESLTILFEGNPDAVGSAYGRVCAEVHREIAVPDRLRKAALVELRPDLPTTLQQRYGVTLTGCDNSSSSIRLEGNHTHFPAARQEVETAMGSLETLEPSLTLATPLLNSARERFRVEDVKGCVFNKDVGAGCVVFALTKQDLQRATQIFQCGFFVETVPNVSAEMYDKLAPTVLSQLVQVERQESNILLKSFVQTEAQTVAANLKLKKEAADLQQSEFPGTPGEIAYLIHLHKTNTEARDFLSSSSLPAKCVVKKNSLYLKGNSQSVQAAQGAIRTRLLAGVSTRSFELHCNEKFLSQVEDFVLRPVADDVTWLKQKQAQSSSTHRQKSSGGRRRSADESEMDVCLIICSKKAEVFQSVCSYLEEVKPSSKKLTLRKGAAQSIKLNEIKPDLEMKYRVRIIGREDFVIIHGLTGREVRECGGDIEERVESSHEIAQHITVTQYQQQFLRAKREQELSELKEECSELHFLSPRNEGESFSVRIKGIVRRVDSVKERLSEMLNSLTTSNFSVSYEQRFFQMWKKRWDQIKRDRERSSDIIIFIDKQPPTAGQKGDAMATTIIHVVGTDGSEVEQVGDLISQTTTQTKTIKLTPSSATALRKDKKEFLWPLAVQLHIKPSNEAVLTAPEDCGEDLETAEEEIQKFLGEKTLTSKNLTSSDEVVGLVLNCPSKSASYLTTAVSIGKGRGVKVHALKKPQAGLRVSGTPAAIQEVEPLLVTRVIRPIEQSIGQDRLSVKPMFKSVFSTAPFRQFNSKLQDEMCVVCTYPRPTNTNKVVRSALIQPSSTAKCLKLELCKGSIINEDSDAIVNAANEDLKHIGGLAKAILDAGGPTVQTESDDYVREHGKVRVGQVVALGPGKLPCKAIIHAVGPRWNGGKSGEESNLYLTVYRSLEAASLAGHGSVSLPAISTGVFGVPGSVCAKASLKAVQDFCQAHPGSALHTVRFVLYQQQELDDFCSCFDSSSIVKAISHGTPPTPVQSTPTPMLAVPTPFTPPAPSHSGVWEWRDDHHSYTPYGSDITRQLSAAYSANPQGSYQFIINSSVYRVDFTTMRQTNLATGHQRRVRYNPSATPTTSMQLSSATPTTSGGVQWYYRDDSGGYSPYSPADSQSIEAMYTRSSSGVIQIGSNTYTFDFGSMCQINTRTNYKRPIQRRMESSVTPSPPPAASYSSPATPTSESQPPSPPKDVLIVLRGPQDSLEVAKAKLERKLGNYVQKETVTIPFACSAEFISKLQSIASKHGVIINVSGKGRQKAQSVVKLEGINSEVQATVKAIQQLIIDHQVSGAESEQDTATPPEWEEQTGTTQVFKVKQGSVEWAKVEQKFRATLSTSQIVTISRIQNSWLWEKYCHHKKRLHLKNNGVVNEMELFHGTRGNDPKLIYEGENGFDMRFSRSGMWGQANYFAVNASYSDSYAYNAPDGHKEMFLVKVLTGDSYNCASNSSLRKPPEKPQGYGSSGKVQFSRMDYDTVTGTTHGSQVYMTYDNDKAYPAYLIKYGTASRIRLY